MKFLSERLEELSRRAHCENEWKKNSGTMNSPSPSKENLDNPFLGSTATTFLQQFRTDQECTWKKIRQLFVRDNWTKVLIHLKHEKISIPPDRLVDQVRSGTLKRMCIAKGLGKKYGLTSGCPGCATSGSHHQASHSDTCRDRMRAELEKSEDGREYLAREPARVDARKQKPPSSSSHKRFCVTGRQSPPEKLWRMGEEDCDNESGYHRHKWCVILQLQAEDPQWTSTVDRPGKEPQMSKQKF